MMGTAVHSKILGKYIERANATDPFFTLVLANQNMAQKAFQMNPGLVSSWPGHISYLLMNSHLCDKKKVSIFISELSDIIKLVNFKPKITIRMSLALQDYSLN
jgi:hypothetical protein